MTTIRARRLSSNLRGAVLASLLALAGLSPAQAADGASAPAPSPASAASAPKVLRYAFRVAETGFDPAKVSDLYSRMVTPHMFEGLYTYDQLARPAKMKPLTAARCRRAPTTTSCGRSSCGRASISRTIPPSRAGAGS
ncbi:hypothetical protein [Mitsuaria sp. TWR114]|uniref:hypothetical protein n=1 Tax=Mitsuaria sp. TWR114 TaxID=2601731 RepID=UPI002107AE61|nr:hypothetical protein [Mitsuaria sp. TWR114]